MKITFLCIALLLNLTNLWSQKMPEQTIAAIIEQWVGQYNNHRQVEQNLLLGDLIAPEITREKRQISVEKLDAPQIGKAVLYLQEFRQSQPNVANRQRVMGLEWDTAQQKVRLLQFFFKTGGTYDRKPLAASEVAKMAATDFDRIDRCDLYFEWDDKNKRYRSAMLPRTCTYQHAVDGEVYADYEMLLYPSQMWYRDRSMRVKNGTIRGEIDGFSWLRFDKIAPLSKKDLAARFPIVVQQEGVWRGTFRRYDAEGKLTAEFASTITIEIDPNDHKKPYKQTNFYTFKDGKTQTIESFGTFEGDKLVFNNDQIEGWAKAIDTTQRTMVISMRYKDGSNREVSEIVSLSADGKKRCRATQYMKDAVIERRTLIEEIKD
jgi:hypothetical protein